MRGNYINKPIHKILPYCLYLTTHMDCLEHALSQLYCIALHCISLHCIALDCIENIVELIINISRTLLDLQEDEQNFYSVVK
jgi:hypothetical protein